MSTTINLREIFLSMIGNYTTNKQNKKTKMEKKSLQYSLGIIIDNNFDIENNHDTVKDIIDLLNIIKKEKGL